MNWLIIITLIILGIVVALAIFIGYIFIVGYSVALGIGYKNETEASAWEYWERKKSKRWDELTEEEQEKMIIANLIIANDVGAVVTKEQLAKMLEEQLPIIEPHRGLTYSHS
ncbi:hypothetical protein [Bacteroides acidifaciens]|uniref:hypothetical protein n=1 Tax=Bacteroides acidifaciens TaxID=85831 RepID=UPI0025B10799|nr:hypothetical protein [Bacteroides acidifaciens]